MLKKHVHTGTENTKGQNTKSSETPKHRDDTIKVTDTAQKLFNQTSLLSSDMCQRQLVI